MFNITFIPFKCWCCRYSRHRLYHFKYVLLIRHHYSKWTSKSHKRHWGIHMHGWYLPSLCEPMLNEYKAFHLKNTHFINLVWKFADILSWAKVVNWPQTFSSWILIYPDTSPKWFMHSMMTSSIGNIFCVTALLCGEFTCPRWIIRTKASDAELWCFLWSASE